MPLAYRLPAVLHRCSLLCCLLLLLLVAIPDVATLAARSHSPLQPQPESEPEPGLASPPPLPLPLLRFPSLHRDAHLQLVHSYGHPMRYGDGGLVSDVGGGSMGRPMHSLASAAAAAAGSTRTGSDPPPADDRVRPAAAALASLPSTFPHRVFLLRVKAPLTALGRQALEAYLHPYRLGEYVPHHSFIVALGEPEPDSDREIDTPRSRIHPRFSLRSPRHASHPSLSLFTAHATARAPSDPQRVDEAAGSDVGSDSSADDPLSWLLRAPGVLSAVPWSREHRVHPLLRAKAQEDVARQSPSSSATATTKRGAGKRAAPEQQEDDTEEVTEGDLHWDFAPFDREASREHMRRTRAFVSRETLQQEQRRQSTQSASESPPSGSTSSNFRRHGLDPLSSAASASSTSSFSAPSSSSVSSPTNAAGNSDTDCDNDATRPFQILSLRIHLHPHPLLRHSARDGVRAMAATLGEASGSSSAQQSSFSPLHRRARRFQREAESYWMEVLDAWARMLESIPSPPPARAADAEWVRRCAAAEGVRGGEEHRLRLRVSTSRYDAHASYAYSSDPSLPTSSLSFEDSMHSLCATSPWHAHFTLLSPSGATSGGMVNLHVSSWFLPLVLLPFLESRTEVAWIEPSPPPMRTLNRFVRPLLQSARGNDTSVFRRSRGRLRGQGHVVQLGDTGVDTDGCFFAHDSPVRGAVSVPVNSFSLTHRKFVTYQLMENADHGDEVEGHGTHVAGTLAGDLMMPSSTGSGDGVEQSLRELASFGGMAPRAKLAFYDLKRTGVDRLLVPPSVYAPYLAHAYLLAGARVSSNSWGSPDGGASGYGSYATEIDRFAHDFPDSLILFAAGNYGHRGFASVSSPGVAKNVLTVGSTRTSQESFMHAGVHVGFRVLQGPAALVASQVVVQVVEANFGPRFSRMRDSAAQSAAGAAVFLADPIDACGPLSAPSLPSGIPGGSFILVRRGSCHFGEKALAVQALSDNIQAMLVVNNVPGAPIGMAVDSPGQDASAFQVTAVMVDQTVGEELIRFLQTLLSLSAAPQLRLQAPLPYSPPSGVADESTLSSFSSRGPTLDGASGGRGRVKPDLLAPGEFVRSVRSDGDLNSPEGARCPAAQQGRDAEEQALLLLEGTSMATPAVAGAAVLVRQYLMEGYHPTGAPNSTHARPSPPSALLKALLIHSTVGVGGEVVTGVAEEGTAYTQQVPSRTPNYFQGFGRLVLDLVLRFDEQLIFAQQRLEAAGGTQVEEEEDVNLSFEGPPRLPLPSLDLIEGPHTRIGSEETHSYCFQVMQWPGWWEDADEEGENERRWVDAATAYSVGSGSTGSRPTPTPSLPAFRATLVWTDPPASVGSASAAALVNNLDLIVVEVGVGQVRQEGGSGAAAAEGGIDDIDTVLPSRAWLGNGWSFIDEDGEHASWDGENTVEQVSIPLPPPAASSDASGPHATRFVVVHVRGTHVVTSLPQQYALVVSGWFNDSNEGSSAAGMGIGSGSIGSKQVPLARCAGLRDDGSIDPSVLAYDGLLCPGQCGEPHGRGVCDAATARCRCNDSFTGDDCSQRCHSLGPVAVGADREEMRWEMAESLIPADGWRWISVSLADLIDPAVLASWTAPAASTALTIDAISAALASSLAPIGSLSVLLVRTSARGDPDLFVSLGGAYPSLRRWDYANMDCDSCAPSPGRPAVRPREVMLPMERVQGAAIAALQSAAAGPDRNETLSAAMIHSALLVRMGIHGYCCDDSTATLVVRAVGPSSLDGDASRWGWLGPLVACLAAGLVLALALFGYRRYKAHRSTGHQRVQAEIEVHMGHLRPAASISLSPQRKAPTKKSVHVTVGRDAAAAASASSGSAPPSPSATSLSSPLHVAHASSSGRGALVSPASVPPSSVASSSSSVTSSALAALSLRSSRLYPSRYATSPHPISVEHASQGLARSATEKEKDGAATVVRLHTLSDADSAAYADADVDADAAGTGVEVAAAAAAAVASPLRAGVRVSSARRSQFMPLSTQLDEEADEMQL